MWASGLHLLFGNACIGVLEGSILARVFKLPLGPAIGVMIVANYFSAWIGVWLLSQAPQDFPIDLYNAWPLLWGMVAVAYVATLLLEWPFVALCFRRQEHWFRHSWRASLLVQSVSYVLLFGWFWLPSGLTLYTKMSIVPLDQISLPADVLVYYIAEDDGNVYLQELGAGPAKKIYELNSHDLNDCLSIEKSRNSDRRMILALLKSKNWGDPKTIEIGVSAPVNALPHDQYNGVAAMEMFALVSPSEGRESKLGSGRQSLWTFQAGYWASQGLTGENSRTGEKIFFALETPFFQWGVRRAIVLPTDRVLFQLGPRQICVLEPDTGKVALLTHGRGAIAVLKSLVDENTTLGQTSPASD